MKGLSNQSDLHLYSTIPTIVGLKDVYTCLGVREFLRNLSQFANIVIWSSMLDGIARQVCTWLFDGLPPPDLVLGQKACGRIPVALKLDLTYLDNSEKKIFLKTLGNALFGKEDGKYTVDNSVLIDDSPEKSILNYTGNAVFLDFWTTDENDSYLYLELQPWLQTLSTTCKVGDLQEYVDRNRIGQSPLCKESYLFGHITRGKPYLQRT